MKGFGLRPLPAAIASMVRPEATEVSVLVENCSAIRFDREFVAMLDQQPVGAFAPFPVVGHPHQHETAMKSLAVKGEFQIALGERLLRTFLSFRLPVAAIPKHNGSAAILTFRDRAFEIAIVERMILNLDGEPLAACGSSEGPRVTAQDLKTPSSSSRRS